MTLNNSYEPHKGGLENEMFLIYFVTCATYQLKQRLDGFILPNISHINLINFIGEYYIREIMYSIFILFLMFKAFIFKLVLFHILTLSNPTF